MRSSKPCIAILLFAFCLTSLIAACANKIEPDNFETAYGRALSHYKTGDIKNAKAALKAVLELKSGEPKAHNLAGLIYEREGSFESAKRSFQEAIRLNKKYDEARNNLLNMDDAKKEYGIYRFATDFIYVLSKEYSNGNNSFIRGTKETKIVRNETGAVLRYDVNYEVYLAKEYFDKCSKALEEAADRATAKPVLDIIDTFSTAIQNRQEAIDLQVEGYGVSESYTGEFERAEAKVEIADTYYVDAAKALEEMMLERRGMFSDKDMAAIKYFITYYSEEKAGLAEAAA